MAKQKSQMPNSIKLLVISYVLLTPFYFWESGLPQTSDFVLLILIILTLISPMSSTLSLKDNALPVHLLSSFVYYALIINLVWSLLYPGTLAFIRNTSFLVFNLATMATFIRLHLNFKYELSRLLYWSLTLSLLIQTASTVLLMGSQGIRTSAFFNNPNQLGYHAVLVAAILTAIHFADRRRNAIHVTNLLLCLVLAAASLSRAAIIPVVLLLLVNIIFEPKGLTIHLRLSLSKIFAVLALTTSLGYFLNSSLDTLSELWSDRVASKGFIAEGSLDDRGYQRISDNPQYWLFGAGSGAQERFSASHELHSTFGDIFFSYGIIGSLLFASAMLVMIKRYPASLLLLGAVFLYGLSHNGIRDGYLWILFALCITTVTLVKKDNEEPRTTHHFRREADVNTNRNTKYT